MRKAKMVGPCFLCPFHGTEKNFSEVILLSEPSFCEHLPVSRVRWDPLEIRDLRPK